MNIKLKKLYGAKTRIATKLEKLIATKKIQNPKSKIQNKNGGDDRIRTCGRLLILNNLANCRFQPLSHVSAISNSRSPLVVWLGQESVKLILAVRQTLSSSPHHIRQTQLCRDLTHLTLKKKIRIVREPSLIIRLHRRFYVSICFYRIFDID